MRQTRSKKPKNESEATLAILNSLLGSRKESDRYFAKQKLKAFEGAEILKSGVRIKRKGNAKGTTPKVGDILTVRYVGARPDGRIFDSGKFTFNLGKGEVIPAWDQAFKKIKEGQEATIFCPSATAYGKSGAGKQIPPHTTLIFDVCIIKLIAKKLD